MKRKDSVEQDENTIKVVLHFDKKAVKKIMEEKHPMKGVEMVDKRLEKLAPLVWDCVKRSL